MTLDAIALQLLTDWTTTALLGILGFALLACVTAMTFAFVYRGFSTCRLPVGVAVLLGLSVVTISLNADAVTGASIIEGTPKIHHATASYVLGVYVAGAVTAEVGRRVGDHFARHVFGVGAVGGGEITTLVQSAGLVVEVELPESVDDLEGYPAVDEATKRQLAGRTMLFPCRLSSGELQSRLVSRLEQDFDLGHVHVDCSDTGEVRSLAVGRRPAGLGHSLGPGTVAVAVWADPPPNVSTGDHVEVWSDEDRASRLLATGKFRAKVGDFATVAVSADDAETFDPRETYRLVTRPDTASDLHRLVASIAEAPETVTTRTVTEDDPLRGEFVGWVPVSVLVIERDGVTVPFPEDNETLAVGDDVYVVGTPDRLHRLADYEPHRDTEGNAEEESGPLGRIVGD